MYSDISSRQYSYWICEWDRAAYIDAAGVPDQSGNAVPEQAVLYADSRTTEHKVTIKDSSTGTQVKLLVFRKGTPVPIGLAVLADLNGNGSAEIAVGYPTATSSTAPSVDITDSVTGAKIKTLSFLTYDYRPISLQSVPDMDGDGVDELIMLAVNVKTDKTEAETRNPVSGVLLSNVKY